VVATVGFSYGFKTFSEVKEKDRKTSLAVNLFDYQKELFYHDLVPDQDRLVETMTRILLSSKCFIEGEFSHGEYWEEYIPGGSDDIIPTLRYSAKLDDHSKSISIFDVTKQRFTVTPLDVVFALSPRKPDNSVLNPFLTLAGQATRRPPQLDEIERLFKRCVQLFVRLEQLSCSLEKIGQEVGSTQKIDASFFPHEIVALARLIADPKKLIRDDVPHEIAAIHNYIASRGKTGEKVEAFLARINGGSYEKELWDEGHFAWTMSEYLEKQLGRTDFDEAKKSSIETKVNERIGQALSQYIRREAKKVNADPFECISKCFGEKQ
jgi:hypothetical protein